MKILCVTPSYWPAFQFGGPINSLHILNKSLYKKGIHIDVYTTNVGLEDIGYIDKEHVLDGIKVKYFSYNKYFEFLGTTGWQFSLPLTLSLKKNLIQFDLVYILGVWNYPVIASSYFCRKYNIPYVISPRGHLYPEVTKKKFWKKKPLYLLFSQRDLNNASVIHYTTNDEANNCHYSLRLKNKYYVVPNGLEISEIQKIRSTKNAYRPRKKAQIILYLGRLNWKKGLDILIDSFVELKKNRTDIHLLIIGNDEDNYKQKLVDQIVKLGLRYIDNEDNDKKFDINEFLKNLINSNGVDVTFTGFLNHKDKFDALLISDVFVLPSFSENFGMSVVEAMAVGIPVIISNRVGISNEVKEANSGIVINVDVKELKDSITFLLDNDIKREEISLNAAKLVRKKYDINKISDSMISQFGSVIRDG